MGRAATPISSCVPLKNGLYSRSMVTTAATKPASKASAKASKTASKGAFSVIKTGGKQFRVSEGDTIKIETLKGEHKVGDKLEFGEVLLTDSGSETKVGTPLISGAKVTGELVEIGRSAKVVVMRYKQKSRSGPTKNGHRQPFFKVKILSI